MPFEFKLTLRAHRYAGLTLLAAMALGACGQDSSETQPRRHEPVVEELITLLDSQEPLKTALQAAIENAAVEDIGNLDDFHRYLDGLVTLIPMEREVVPHAIKFYYIIGQAPEDRLNENAEFSEWMHHLAEAWGEFLDTPTSAKGIETFLAAPDYHAEDYVSGPSGWLTFNQFFARQIRAGKRPIEDARDDSVIVSPADATFMGAWPIDENSNITVKGANWAISELLDGSPYHDAFRNGVYTHCFLRVTDYHRYHTPVAGEVKEVRNIHGRVYLDLARDSDGRLHGVDGETYQFNQERGLVVIDSPKLGLVAVLPVGMSFISSVTLTTDVGAQLRKGDEFGYFQFGGSDIVMLFEHRDIRFEAEAGTKYLQGQRIAAVR